MESIISLEELIKENEAKIVVSKRQLADHESGEHKLSPMKEASTENSLEAATELVAKYKVMLDKLLLQDQTELAEKERLIAIATRKKYFDAQNSRIKLNIEQSNDKKLTAMRIIEELPTDIQFEDEELFEIATKSIELGLPDLKELSDKLGTIKKEFNSLLKQSDKKDMQEMGTIDFLIPIIVLHFYVLSSNIKENIDDINNKEIQKRENILQIRQDKKDKLLEEIQERENLLKEKVKEEIVEPEEENSNIEEMEESKEDIQEIVEPEEENAHIEEIEEAISIEVTEEMKRIASLEIAKKLEEIKQIEAEPLPEIKELKFSGFPKYHDWWIRELWLSHQAYFALYKWKNIINKLCRTTEQKKAWSIIFDRWVFIKKLLNDKGELAFNYNYIFDSLMTMHAGIEEEMDVKNIFSMDLIIQDMIKKEDFSVKTDIHNTNTPYLKFKKGKPAFTEKSKEKDVKREDNQ